MDDITKLIRLSNSSQKVFNRVGQVLAVLLQVFGVICIGRSAPGLFSNGPNQQVLGLPLNYLIGVAVGLLVAYNGQSSFKKRTQEKPSTILPQPEIDRLRQQREELESLAARQ